MSALHLPHAQMRPLAIADLAGAFAAKFAENAESDAARIILADLREIAHRPGDHKVHDA